MRTTLTLDEDVAQKIKTLSKTMRTPFKALLNQVLRLGLKQVKNPSDPKPYVTKCRALHLKAGLNLDNIQELLAEIEGEDQK